MTESLIDFTRWLREHAKPAEGESYFERQIVSRVPQKDGTYFVKLSCGHTSIWVIKPYATLTPCAQCVNEYVERFKQEKG